MAWAYEKLCPFDYSKVQDCRPEHNMEVFDLFARYYEDAEGFPNIRNIYYQLVAMEHEITDNIEKTYFYYLIIMAIDSYEYKYDSLSSVFKCVRSMESLNINNNRVLIYPKMQKTLIDEMSGSLEKYEKKVLKKKRGGLRKTRDIDTNGINKTLSNYIIVERTDLKQYNVNIHMLQDGDLFAKQVLGKKHLDIIVFPFDDRNIEDIMDIEINEKTFCLRGHKQESELSRRYMQLIERAVNSNADIVVFPEMYLSQNMIDNVIKKLRHMRTERSMIIIMGTLWENESNICFICDHRGKLIIKQHKQSPFDFKGKHEDLKNKEEILHFMDIDGIGRFAFGVCKDIDNDRILDIMKVVASNIYIFPAFSSSLNVKRTADGIATGYNGITIFANACAALCDEDSHRVDLKEIKNVGFITIPCKYKNDSGVKDYYYSYERNCNGCDACEGKRISINFDKIVNNNEMIYCDISYR